MMTLLYNFHSENVVTKRPKVQDVPLQQASVCLIIVVITQLESLTEWHYFSH